MWFHIMAPNHNAHKVVYNTFVIRNTQLNKLHVQPTIYSLFVPSIQNTYNLARSNGRHKSYVCLHNLTTFTTKCLISIKSKMASVGFLVTASCMPLLPIRHSVVNYHTVVSVILPCGPFDNNKKTVRSRGERSLPGGMKLHHYQQHKSAQSQQHLLCILLHYFSHQLQMLHEVEFLSPCDLQKHYIIKQTNYKESNRTGKTVSASSMQGLSS